MSPDSIDMSFLSDVLEEMNVVYPKLDEIIDNFQKQKEMCKKRIEIEGQNVREVKLNQELKQQLAELTQKTNDVNSLCGLMASKLTIGNNDKTRLENARELVLIGKELTHIKFDFQFCEAHPNMAKGYIKNEAKRLLEPFEMETNSDALWDLILTIFTNQGRNENESPNI